MEHNEIKGQTIQHLTELKRQLFERRERLMRPINELDKQIAGVISTIGLLLDSSRPIDEVSPRTVLLRKLKGMTQPMALVEIAKYNDGALNAQEAKALMIHAGVMRETKNSSSIVHSVIARTGSFVRVGRGKYRLKPVGLRVAGVHTEIVDNAPEIGTLPLKPVQ
jgi:hypothetical protein